MQESQPIINRVKILGWDSKNRRRYLPESVQTSLYEGLFVNIDHPDSPTQSRRLRDRFGRLQNVAIDGDGVWADLKYNPGHSLAEQVRWAAENDPGMIGLSHNAMGSGRTEDGVFIVEKVISVRSVDLVADPATTKGLYEAMEPELGKELPEVPAGAEGDEQASVEERIGHLVLAILQDDAMPLKTKRTKILKALKLMDDTAEEEPEEDVEEEDEEEKPEREEEHKDEEEEDEEMDESVRLLRQTKDPAVKALIEKLDRIEAEQAITKKRERALELCEQAKLPEDLRSAVFLEHLMSAKDEKAMKALIEDRRQIASIKRPVSASKGSPGKQISVKDFAKAIKGGKS